MAKTDLPTPEVLRQLLRYDPNTGKLFWLPRPISMFPNVRSGKIWNTKNAHKEAFKVEDPRGYRRGQVLDQKVWAHRVAFALHHGYWADGDVDHINGDKGDNRAENLRDTTRSQNLQNQAARKGSTSIFLGVSWSKSSRAWVAQIGGDGATKFIGRFSNEIEAAIAYDEAAKDRFGPGARTNFR